MQGGATYNLLDTMRGDFVLNAATVQAILSANQLWFVNADPTYGSDTNPGTAAYPFATIGKAVASAVSGRGDVIYVWPSTYAENIVTTKARLSMIGALPFGNAKRVAIAPASGIALDLQTGALAYNSFGIRHVGTGAVGVKLAADGARFDQCDFTSSTTHGLATVGQTVDNANTGSGLVARNCIFRECGGSGINQGFATGKTLFATNVNIIGCQFYLNTAYDIVDENEGAGQGYWDHWQITGCAFMDKSKTTYLNMNGAGTDAGAGTIVCGNWFNSVALDSTKIQMPSSGLFVGNFDVVGVVNGTGF